MLLTEAIQLCVTVLAMSPKHKQTNKQTNKQSADNITRPSLHQTNTYTNVTRSTHATTTTSTRLNHTQPKIVTKIQQTERNRKNTNSANVVA